MADLPTAFQVGSTVYSSSRFHADDDMLPLGGVVIDIYPRVDAETGESVMFAHTVTVYRGQVVYTHIPVDDIEPGESLGLIRRDVLKRLATSLAADEVKHRDPFRHDVAKRAIQRVLVERGDPSVVGTAR